MRLTCWSILVVPLLPAWAMGQSSQPTSQAHAPSRRRPPAIQFPTRHAYTRLHPDRVAVLEPLFDPSPAEDWNVLVVYSGGALTLFDPVKNRSLWPAAVPCPNEPELLCLDDRQLVLATSTQIFCLARENGRSRWRIGETTSTAPDDDPEWQSTWIDHIATGSRLISATDRHELVCIDLRNGSVAWREKDGPQTSDMLAADKQHVVVYTERENSGTLTCRSTESGLQIAQSRIAFDGTLQSLQMTHTGTLLAATSTELVAIDPATLKTIWRIPGRPVIYASTLLIDHADIFVSLDGHTLARLDMATGEKQWQTPRVGTAGATILWASRAESRIFAGTPKTLAAFDIATGQLAWQNTGITATCDQPPLAISDGVLSCACTAAAPPPSASQPATSIPTTSQSAVSSPAGCRLVLKWLKFADGPGSESPDSSVTTEPLASFGGVFVRDHAVIVLDGSRLIGYVDATIKSSN